MTPSHVRLSHRSALLPGSAIRVINDEVARLRSRGVDVYKFHIGQPGLPPSVEMLREFADELLKRPFEYSAYTPSSGLYEVKEAIAEDYTRYSGVKVLPENITVTTGASEAIAVVLMSLIDEGDEVLLFDPTYVLYEPLIQFLGGRPKRIKAKEELGWRPNEEELKNAVKGVKAVIAVNPDNPTGRALDENFVKLLVDLAIDHDFIIIYDEAYRHLYYEGSHVYAIRYDFERVIALNSFSKDPALPGWRLGFIVAHDGYIKAFNRVKQYLNLNPPTPSQYLALLYLRKYKEKYLESVIPRYKSRLETMYKALREYLPEAHVVKSNAGLFLFPNLKPYLERMGVDDREFALELLREAHVAVVPGSFFGEEDKYHVRLCFAGEDENRIVEGVKAIASFIHSRISTRPVS